MGIEFLRMAAIHTPTALSTAMGLIAAVLIGQIAIAVGLFSAEVILYVSIAAIGSFTTPSYELSLANKMIRLILMVLVAIFQVKGFVIGFTLLLIIMANIRSFHTPYLWPFYRLTARRCGRCSSGRQCRERKSDRALFTRKTVKDSQAVHNRIETDRRL